MSGWAESLRRVIGMSRRPIVLRRISEAGGGSFGNVDLPLLASVRPGPSRELNGTITQSDDIVTINANDVRHAGWPWVLRDGSQYDDWLPKRGDRVIINGRVKTVMAVEIRFVHGEPARIDLVARGP